MRSCKKAPMLATLYRAAVRVSAGRLPVMAVDHRGGAFRQLPPCRDAADQDIPAGHNQARPLYV
jgi:hypothetical protein